MNKTLCLLSILYRFRDIACYLSKIADFISSVKISNSWKSKMAAAAILKITKIAISPQHFDRSLQNLVWWCKMGLLTFQTVKKLNFFIFQKSKMVDSCHSENRQITISLQPFDRFWLNLARWCMLVPNAWRKVQIFNFRQSYMAVAAIKRIKNCFNILSNYTMTHYTILTIKQQ